MVRYKPYCLPTPSKFGEWIDSFKNSENVPLEVQPLQEKLSKLTLRLEHAGQNEYNVAAHSSGRIVFTFCFSQMEGNCGAMMVNRLQGDVQLGTYLLKNIMSTLGNNVCLTSNWDKRVKPLINSGWTDLFSTPSNRDAPTGTKIHYLSLTLPKDDMLVSRFSPRVTMDKFKKEHPVVTDDTLGEQIIPLY